MGEPLERLVDARVEREPRSFEQDLILPRKVVGDLVASADILSATGRGYFYIQETHPEDEDMVRVHYSGNKDFTAFAIDAKRLAEEMNQKSPRPPRPNIPPRGNRILPQG